MEGLLYILHEICVEAVVFLQFLEHLFHIFDIVTAFYPILVAQQSQPFADLKFQVLWDVGFLVRLATSQNQDFHLLAVVLVAKHDEVRQDQLQNGRSVLLAEVVEEDEHHVVQHRGRVGFAFEQGHSLERTAAAEANIGTDEREQVTQNSNFAGRNHSLPEAGVAVQKVKQFLHPRLLPPILLNKRERVFSLRDFLQFLAVAQRLLARELQKVVAQNGIKLVDLGFGLL